MLINSFVQFLNNLSSLANVCFELSIYVSLIEDRIKCRFSNFRQWFKINISSFAADGQSFDDAATLDLIWEPVFENAEEEEALWVMIQSFLKYLVRIELQAS